MTSRPSLSICFIAFCIGTICLTTAYAQPNNQFGGGQDGPEGSPLTGGPPSDSPFGRSPPQFIQDLNDGNRTVFFSIKSNTTLTKGQIVSAIQNWLQGLPENVQNDYTSWQSNITNIKNQFISNIKANLSADGAALFDQIQSIVDDQTITYPETCEQILAAINSSSANASAELHFHANANGIGQNGPGGASYNASSMPPPTPNMTNPCNKGPAAFHDGPGGGLNPLGPTGSTPNTASSEQNNGQQN